METSLDLASIEGDLTRAPHEAAGLMKWLTHSYEEPQTFWPLLMEACSRLTAPPLKSRAFARYDFFHDIVARHQKSPSPAFRWYDRLKGWKAMSYEELGNMAAEMAARWTRLGAAPGQKLCILSPLSQQSVTAFVAAMKIGLVVSLLPAGGKSFLHKRIEALAPDCIWTEELYTQMIPDFRHLVLPETMPSGEGEPDSRSHAYGSGEPFAFCFDPCTEEPHVPKVLNSDAAYLCAVRDGLIALGLKPGMAFASPVHDPLQAQPALLLACLLTGATYVHMSLEDVERNPELLAQHPLRALGVSVPVREILLQRPFDASKAWQSWFRDPGESQDLSMWTDFVQALSLKQVPAGNQRWNSSLGGCLLFSIKRTGHPHLQVLPSAGVRWRLSDPVDPKRESLYDHGLFAPCYPGGEEEAPVVSGGILAAVRKEWMYLRPIHTGRWGRCYPAGEVLEVLEGRIQGLEPAIAEVPVSGSTISSRFVLLLFAGARKIGEASVAEEIRKELVRELGRDFLPDRIEIVHLHPRLMEDGSLDHGWCAGHYLSGALSRRQRGEIFQVITELREQLRAATP